MNYQEARGSTPYSEGGFRAAVIGGAIVVCAAVFYVRFGYELEFPAMPPKPAGAVERARDIADQVGRSERAYREHVRRDARRFGVSTEPDEMERGFMHHHATPDVTLAPSGERRSIEAAGLRLTIEVESISGSHRHQMVLAIDNLLDRPLAYRVMTRPTAGTRTCRHKRALPHDAIAVAPGARERRSECTYQPGWGLEVQRVDTVELPELAYYYLSQLRPRDIGLSSRTSAAHRPVSGAPCDLIVSTQISNALESGELSWRNAVDFYARHDCRRYAIPAGYSGFQEDGERQLPAVGASR